MAHNASDLYQMLCPLEQVSLPLSAGTGLRRPIVNQGSYQGIKECRWSLLLLEPLWLKNLLVIKFADLAYTLNSTRAMLQSGPEGFLWPSEASLDLPWAL